MLRVLLLVLVVLAASLAVTLRRHQIPVATQTISMFNLSLPADSRWRALIFSLPRFLLLEPFEQPLNETHQTFALAELLIHFDPLPGASTGDSCQSLANAARRTMRRRALDAGETGPRDTPIAQRAAFIDSVCRQQLGDKPPPLNADEVQAFRDAKFISDFVPVLA